MNSQHASSLILGYPRYIVGFDFRIGKQDQDIFPATIDNQVWPRQPIDHASLDENGFNLFDGPIKKITTGRPQINSVLVAFDLPVIFVDALAATFGIVPLPVNLLSARAWIFLGFDIIDARTQSSGIYSFDWAEEEFTFIIKKLSLQLNKNGLVDNETNAIKAAIFFDSLVKEHAPFAPCGVWVNRKNDLWDSKGELGQRSRP